MHCTFPQLYLGDELEGIVPMTTEWRRAPPYVASR